MKHFSGVLVSLWLASVVASAQALTVADLKALAAQKAWAELLESAEKVAPATRNAGWQELVASAAAQVLRAAPVGKDGFEAVAKAESLKSRYPFLEARPDFAKAKDEVILTATGQCLAQNNTDCLKMLSAADKSLSPSAALNAGKLYRKNGFAAYQSMALFSKAIAVKDAAACKDADVVTSTLAALDTPVDSEWAPLARKIAFEWCWSAMGSKLKAAMVGASSYRNANCCASMRDRKALTPLQEDLCQDEER